MKLAVVGSRGFSDYDLMTIVLDEYYLLAQGDLEIVSGGAPGADRLAQLYADEGQIPCKIFPAQWHKYGKRAGYVRNADIIDYADEVVAFWDSESKGTLHSINLAKKVSKTVVVIEYAKHKEYGHWNNGR